MSRTFVLQDWVTIRGNLGTTPLVQDEGRWLDLAGFSDVTCWVDVCEVTPPAGTTSNYVTLSLETAAVCDDAYFTPAASTNFGASQTYLNVASTTPVVLRSGSSQATSNLMRYLRWKITPNLTGLWDLTFRIRAVATRNQTFAPTLLSGCVLWLRGDLGVTLNAANGNAVSAWADQSGSGNSASQGTAANQPTLVANAINGLPAITGNGSSQYLVTSAFTAQSTGTLFAVVQSAVSTQLAYIRILEQQFNTTYYLGVNSTGTKYKLIVNNGLSPYGTAEAGTVDRRRGRDRQRGLRVERHHLRERRDADDERVHGSHSGEPADVHHEWLQRSWFLEWLSRGSHRLQPRAEHDRAHARTSISGRSIQHRRALSTGGPMHSFVLQDWITIRGTTGAVITQGESGWLDLAPYQDVSFYIDIREFSPSAGNMVFETAPIKEDVLFQAMLSSIAFTTAPTNPYRVPITTASCPVARYVRWKLTGPASTPWDITFRVVLAATALGL